MAQDSENLYFGFRGAGKSRWALRKVSKQGGELQTIVTAYTVHPIIVDETNIYFFDEESLTRDAFCKVSKQGGEVARLDTGYAGNGIAQSQKLIYFSSLDDIYSFPK